MNKSKTKYQKDWPKWKVIIKKDQEITKALEIPGLGCIVRVTTYNLINNDVLTDTMVFVPNVIIKEIRKTLTNLTTTNIRRKLIPINKDEDYFAERY